MKTAKPSHPRNIKTGCAIAALLFALCAVDCKRAIAETNASVRGSSAVAVSHLSAADDEGDSVDSAGSALGRWRTYPWYDAGTDDVRPIDLEEEEPPTRTHVGISSFVSGLLFWTAWLLLAAILGVLVYLVIRNWLEREARQAVPSVQLDSDRLESVEALPAAARRARGDLLEEARRRYAEGRFGEAVIFLFSYQLVQLDKHDLIRLTKGKTNRQYMREISGRGPLERLVEQTMQAFEDVFFGGRPLGRGAFEACWNRVGEFQQLVAEGRT